jgi:hypothetical protein
MIFPYVSCTVASNDRNLGDVQGHHFWLIINTWALKAMNKWEVHQQTTQQCGNNLMVI